MKVFMHVFCEVDYIMHVFCEVDYIMHVFWHVSTNNACAYVYTLCLVC